MIEDHSHDPVNIRIEFVSGSNEQYTVPRVMSDSLAKAWGEWAVGNGDTRGMPLGLSDGRVIHVNFSAITSWLQVV